MPRLEKEPDSKKRRIDLDGLVPKRVQLALDNPAGEISPTTQTERGQKTKKPIEKKAAV